MFDNGSPLPQNRGHAADHIRRLRGSVKSTQVNSSRQLGNGAAAAVSGSPAAPRLAKLFGSILKRIRTPESELLFEASRANRGENPAGIAAQRMGNLRSFFDSTLVTKVRRVSSILGSSKTERLCRWRLSRAYLRARPDRATAQRVLGIERKFAIEGRKSLMNSHRRVFAPIESWPKTNRNGSSWSMGESRRIQSRTKSGIHCSTLSRPRKPRLKGQINILMSFS